MKQPQKDIFVAPSAKQQQKQPQENQGVSHERREPSQTQQEAQKILSQIDKPLLVVKSFFPFDFFPDTLRINPL